MSFINIPGNTTIESLLSITSSPDSHWVPTLQLTYVNEKGQVGLSKANSLKALHTPRGTLASQSEVEKIAEAISSVAIRRATGTFGKGYTVKCNDLVLVPKIAKIIKPVDQIEKDIWQNAEGIVLVPAVVSLDSRFSDPPLPPRLVQWEAPDTAIELLQNEVIKFGRRAVISRTSADAITACLPFIPQLVESHRAALGI